MKIKGETMAGLTVIEYFLVLKLSPEIEQRAEEIREELYRNCEVNLKLVGRPVMGLVHFAQYAGVEEKLTELLRRIIAKLPPFNVHLNSIGSIPSHTIFIDTEKSEALTTLVNSIQKEARKFFQLNKETSAMVMRKPHITLTRKLDLKNYDRCIKAAADLFVDESFLATTITLLSREPGTRQWTEVDHYQLKGEAPKSQQGELF